MSELPTAVPDSPVEPAAFRAALGRFATGVVVVAAIDGGAPHGLAVNSFTSVSLDPPLVGFCADRSSSTWPRIRAAGGFTVSVLSDGQERVCRTFARKGADRFASLTWTAGATGHPRLDGALAWLDCTVERVHRAGDHDLVLGRVRALATGEGSPLLFFGGAFGHLRPVAPASAGGPVADPALEDFARLHGLDLASPFFDVLASHLGAPSR